MSALDHATNAHQSPIRQPQEKEKEGKDLMVLAEEEKRSKQKKTDRGVSAGKGFSLSRHADLPNLAIIHFPTEFHNIAWPRSSPMILENHIDKNARTHHENQHEKERDFPVFPKRDNPETEDENHNGSEEDQNGWDISEMIQLFPRGGLPHEPTTLSIIED
jgi:hypothetical protein